MSAISERNKLKTQKTTKIYIKILPCGWSMVVSVFVASKKQCRDVNASAH